MSSYSATSLNALTGSLVALTVLSVGLRFYARFNKNMRLWWDDWVVLMALISFLGVAGIMFEFVHLGILGIDTISDEEQLAKLTTATAARLQVALVFVSVFCLGCSKESACLFYYRIFVVQSSIYGKIVFISTIFVALWTLAFLILFGTSCDGHWSGLWKLELHAKYCSHLWTNLYAISISDVVLDVYVLALPLFPVYQLHASAKRRVYILAIFLLGAVALGASIARLVIWVENIRIGFQNVSATGAERFQSKTFFYFTLEAGISVIAANLPIAGPLLMRTDVHEIAKRARSLVSLASGNSSGSRADSISQQQQRKASATSSPSHKSMAIYDSNLSNEAYAMHDIHNPKRADEGKIYVEDLVEVVSKPKSAEEQV